MSSPRTLSCLARLAALALLAIVTTPKSVRADSEEPSQPVRRYPVRAEIVRVPEKPGGYLTVRHEAVDDFVDVTGELVGMSSMVMEFPVARGASIEGLKVGDKIEATLVVDFTRGYGELDHIKKLPRSTALQFRKARRRESTTPRTPRATSSIRTGSWGRVGGGRSPGSTSASSRGTGWASPASHTGSAPRPPTSHSKYKLGDAVLWSAHGQYRPVTKLALDLGLDGRYAVADRAVDSDGTIAARVENTGGTVLSLAPGVYWNALGKSWLFVRSQVPVYKHLFGEQDVKPSFTAGIQYQVF